MAGETPEVLEFLLNCQICLEPFDQTLRIPRILPCHHTFCGPCIAKLDRGGVLTCPNDRGEIDVSGPFPVDFTRASVVEHKDVLLLNSGASSSLEEACQKHQDKKLEFFCSTCKSALCSECAVIEHKNQVGHDIVRLGGVLEQVKKEIESRCVELDNIRESSLQPHAKMAATSLQETEASFKAAEQEIEDVFSKVVNVLLDRKDQAVEELRSKWKEDRKEREEQKAETASQVSGAKTLAALGRSVSSVGLPSHLVAQNEELKRAVQEARAEEAKSVLSALRYKVNTNLVGLMKCIPELGTICTVTSLRQPVASTSTAVTSPRQPEASTSVAVTSPRQPVASTSTAVTSSTIQTPGFQLEPGRCNAGCTLEEDGRTLTSKPRPQSGGTAWSGFFQLFGLQQSDGTGQSGPQPFTFPGTCGSVDLTQPALHYWTVRCGVLYWETGDRCEIGLASLQSMQTCGREERISDHDLQAATIVVVGKEQCWKLEGRGWSKDLDTPPPPVTSDTPYTCLETKPPGRYFKETLGFLYDNRQPQSPRVLVVETESCRFLGVRRLSPSPDLRPVLRVWPSSFGSNWDVKLEVGTGPGILDDVIASWLQGLLGRMER